MSHAPTVPSPSQVAALGDDWADIAERAGLGDDISVYLDGALGSTAAACINPAHGEKTAHLHADPHLATAPVDTRRWVLAHEAAHILTAGPFHGWAALIRRAALFMFSLIGCLMLLRHVDGQPLLTANLIAAIGGGLIASLTASYLLRRGEYAADAVAAAVIDEELQPHITDWLTSDEPRPAAWLTHSPWSTHPPWSRRRTRLRYILPLTTDHTTGDQPGNNAPDTGKDPA